MRILIYIILGSKTEEEETINRMVVGTSTVQMTEQQQILNCEEVAGNYRDLMGSNTQAFARRN
jgi:ribulose kinase